MTDAEAIAPFAELGIVLLLFSIGLELSFRRLFAMRKMVFGIGAAEMRRPFVAIEARERVGDGEAVLGVDPVERIELACAAYRFRFHFLQRAGACR